MDTLLQMALVASFSNSCCYIVFSSSVPAGYIVFVYLFYALRFYALTCNLGIYSGHIVYWITVAEHTFITIILF